MLDIQNILSDQPAVESINDQYDQEVAALNMKMQNFDEEEEDGEGNHHDYDIELLLQLDQLNDLDQSQLDEEQLE